SKIKPTPAVTRALSFRRALGLPAAMALARRGRTGPGPRASGRAEPADPLGALATTRDRDFDRTVDRYPAREDDRGVALVDHVAVLDPHRIAVSHIAGAGLRPDHHAPVALEAAGGRGGAKAERGDARDEEPGNHSGCLVAILHVR